MGFGAFLGHWQEITEHKFQSMLVCKAGSESPKGHKHIWHTFPGYYGYKVRL